MLKKTNLPENSPGKKAKKDQDIEDVRRRREKFGEREKPVIISIFNLQQQTKLK